MNLTQKPPKFEGSWVSTLATMRGYFQHLFRSWLGLDRHKDDNLEQYWEGNYPVYDPRGEQKK